MGYPVKGPSPALTPIDTSITIPKDDSCVNTCTYDSRYLITIKPGMKAKKIAGTDHTYEIPEEIDFSSQWDSLGKLNRTITPIFRTADENQVWRYKITKRVIATAGETKTMRFHVFSRHSVPNLEVIIPEGDIIEIVDIIAKEDSDDLLTVAGLRATDWETINYKWYQVDYLAQDKLWVDMTPGETTQTKTGYWKSIYKRYVTERNFNGTTSVIFG